MSISHHNTTRAQASSPRLEFLHLVGLYRRRLAGSAGWKPAIINAGKMPGAHLANAVLDLLYKR